MKLSVRVLKLSNIKKISLNYSLFETQKLMNHKDINIYETSRREENKRDC